jgi:Domain of unknown function (DUF4349)
MTSTVLVRRCAFGGAILLAGCLLLTACGSGSGTSSPASASAPGPLAPVTHQNAAAGSAINGSASGGSAAAAPAGRSAAGGGATTLTAGLAPVSQSIVYTASIEIRAESVSSTARRITDIVESAGGYISAETTGSTTGPTAGSTAGSASPGQTGQTISITVKIPVPVYDAVLGQLSSPTLGKQLSMHQQATDVTQQVANVSSLVTSEQDAITALDGLLQRAASVSDLLQVQQQISADESTLNSLLAQQRALGDETSYATVSMTLIPPPHVIPHKKPAGHSFLTGLRSGWRALRHAAGWAATALGAGLPFLIILAVLAALGYAGRRRYQRRRIGPPAAE